ncbi:BCNT-domain-containing protein, partial [Pyrenochaeta sp. DS3sAY3a]
DDDLDNPDEKYHESSDEDFNPDSAPADNASSSEDEGDAAEKPAQRKGKRKAHADDGLDSGDEVTIQGARKQRAKKKKTKKGGSRDDDDDNLLFSDDEGGLIKTRAQRKVEQKERRPLARTDGATVDVDALWAQMTAAPLAPLQPVAPSDLEASKDPTANTRIEAPDAADDEEQVSVKKVYTFAGQDTIEEKQIPASQLEKYLSSGWRTADTPAAATTTAPEDTPSATPNPVQINIRRPLRRPSRFDPNPLGYVRALPPEHQLSWPRKVVSAIPSGQKGMAPPAEIPKAKPEKAQKLNVVDKSRMDWTGFVDKEGIAEELDTHGKTKEAYLGRMDFLAGVEARREEERLRMKSAAAAAS